MEPDYPAAHSMDTDWYAVDRDGHVALFESGEAGAVPSPAGIEGEHTLLERFARAARWSLADYQPTTGGPEAPAEQHKAVEGRLRAKPADDEFDWDSSWTLMFLESEEPVRDQIARGVAIAAPATEGVAVIVKNLTRPLADRLHRAGACLGCFGPYTFDELPELLGLYTYEHSCENWISGPYERRGNPTRPLRADQLPLDSRALVEGMRFASLSFAEAEQIQPVDHAECDSWESAYLDLDGKTIRALPGREAEFLESYANDRQIREEFRIEPPAEPS